MAKLLFYPSLQDCVLNVTPFQIVIKHLFFSMRREKVITINDTLSNFLKGRHSASIPSWAKPACPNYADLLTALRLGKWWANQSTFGRIVASNRLTSDFPPMAGG